MYFKKVFINFFILLITSIIIESAEIEPTSGTPDHSFSHTQAKRPFWNAQLHLLRDRTKIEWGGIGENCIKEPGFYAAISQFSRESTISIDIDPIYSDSLLFGDLFDGKGFTDRYPSFSELFKGRIEEILVGHIGYNLFEKNEIWKRHQKETLNDILQDPRLKTELCSYPPEQILEQIPYSEILTSLMRKNPDNQDKTSLKSFSEIAANGFAW